MHGLWFIRGDMVRDVAALNKLELLPWDGWGLVDGEEDDLSDDDWTLLDRIARLSLSDNEHFHELRAAYLADERLRVPAVVKSYRDDGFEMIDLTEGDLARVAFL